MKKRFAAWLAAVLLLTSCAGGTGETPANSSESESGSWQEDKSDIGSTIPGTWTVPDGWIEMETYSSEDKVFYVEEGNESEELPDNISIEVGANRYSAEEHELFRDAIVRQLLMQTQGLDAELTGDGTFTEQDYILYIFTITETNVVTKQFYIVGDQRYCLVHLTNFTGSEAVEEAARSITDSFVWNSSED